MDGEIQYIGSRAHQDVLDKLKSSCGFFRDEVGAQLNCLRYAQWQLDGGVNYLATAVDSILAERSGRSDMQPNGISELFTAMQKVMVELENNKVTAIQTKNEVESHNQKLERVNGNIKAEVGRSIGSVLRKYTGSTKQEANKGDAKLLSKPYLGDTIVEYKIVSPMDVHQSLDRGKAARKLGI